MYEYGTPDSGQYVDPTQGGALGEIFEYSLGSQIPRTKAPKSTALRGLGATAARATSNAIATTAAVRARGGCCDTCSCNCAGSGCCPDCAARGVRRTGGSAMQGLGATPRMVTVVGLPSATPPLPLPYQPLPGALPTTSSSSMLPILLIGGLGVGAFLVIRRMRARAATAPASNPRRRRRR